MQEGEDEFMSYVLPGQVLFLLLSPRFNGDWVDRGRHQLEVMLLILSLKTLCSNLLNSLNLSSLRLRIMHPKHVWLNRGNHEDRQQNLRTTKIGAFESLLFVLLQAAWVSIECVPSLLLEGLRATEATKLLVSKRGGGSSSLSNLSSNGGLSKRKLMIMTIMITIMIVIIYIHLRSRRDMSSRQS